MTCGTLIVISTVTTGTAINRLIDTSDRCGKAEFMHPDIMLYEAHVTIEPVFDKRFEEFERCCAFRKFKPAELFMQKKREDTPERSNKDSFCTGHGTDYDEIYGRTFELVQDLRSAGFAVWRYKIEGIVLDVKLERLFTIQQHQHMIRPYTTVITTPQWGGPDGIDVMPALTRRLTSYAVHITPYTLHQIDAYCQRSATARKIPSNYNSGIIHNAQRIGKIAEAGFGKLIGIEPDFGFREGGDKTDFCVFGKSIDVKATTRLSPDVWHILAVTETGLKKEMTSDYYLFCCVVDEKDTTTVHIVGYVTREYVITQPIVSGYAAPGKIARHCNYDIPLNALNDISEMKLPIQV